ncbi:hypothetical protein [Endozoicomonas sp. ONNA1]|uniref:hypothetical protein n=1 Tax=Endozoicomonas sp. ONNA1 TaxID=2828740 RepID=UPI00214751FB|nr:hypothetical protein [Endozoicomonas sp. ONNA1]
MEDSSVSDDLMLISPLFFFLPVSTYTSLWGAPEGTAIFKFLEKETGIETGISEKTLRKYFLGSPKKAPTNSVKAKLERWLHNLGNSGLMKEWIYPRIPSFWYLLSDS